MKLLLRYGSHSEKRYYENMLRFFDGVIFSANLLEVTPAATVSLISKFCGKKHQKPYIIDPITYSFGEFYNHKLRSSEKDLRWLMSETKKRGLDVKKSYSKLANSLGSAFEACIREKKAISIEKLKEDKIIDSICEATIQYQKNRLKNLLKKDHEYAHFADDLPTPCMIFAPYFFIHPGKVIDWLEIIEKITNTSIQYERSSLYIKLCFNKEMLLNEDAISKIIHICKQPFKGVWLWVNNFDEKEVDSKYLLKFGEFVERISQTGKEVFNRHGGFYSIMLAKVGMNGVSNAVGYGEKKDIMPALGQASPTVNYYYPTLHKKYGIPDIEQAFADLEIVSPESFFRYICNCVICKGVIEKDIANFKKFGEQHLATSNSKKTVQTPTAAEKSRYHYLLCKLKEKNNILNSNAKQIISKLEQGVPIADLDIFKGRARHITKWLESFKKITKIS